MLDERHVTPLDDAALEARRSAWRGFAQPPSAAHPYRHNPLSNKCAAALLRHATALALRGAREHAAALLAEVTGPLDDNADVRAKITRRSRFAAERVVAHVALGQIDAALAASVEFDYARGGESAARPLVEALVRDGRREDAELFARTALDACAKTSAIAKLLPALLRLAEDERALIEATSIAREAVDACHRWVSGEGAQQNGIG